MRGDNEGNRLRRPTFEALEPRLLLSGVSAVPDMPDLLDAFDTGVSQSDDITRLDNSDPSKALAFSVSGAVVGATVTVYADSTAIGSVVAADVSTIVATDGTHDLIDGAQSITARQVEPDKTESAASAALGVTIDTVAPPVDTWGLDTTFSGDGKLTTDFGPYPQLSTDSAGDIAIQADGKIVAAGVGGRDDDEGFALARYNADGSLDTSFDGDGKLTTDFGTGNDYAYAVAIQPDGKIVAAGRAAVGGNEGFALVRYNADGSLDTSFDVDGKLTTAIGTGTGYATAIAIQPDGKIVAAGRVYIGGSSDFALVRYNADGSLDTSFDGDGMLTTDFNARDDNLHAMAIQPDGKIVVTGATVTSVMPNPDNWDFALARYNADGSLDTTFNGDGKLTTDIGAGDDVARAIAIQPDGKIIAAGSAYNIGDYDDFALTRYNADGSLDTTFDGDGKATTTIGISSSFAHALAIEPDGKIVVAGSARIYHPNDFYLRRNNLDFALARYNPDGSLDTTFSGDGMITTTFGSGNDVASAMAIQSDGRIVLAGVAYINSSDFGLARYANASIDLQAASDMGLSDTDNITTDNTPTFNVLVSPYFRLYRDGLLISGLYESGTSYTTAGQPDGTFAYSVSAVDAAGNVSPMSEPLYVTFLPHAEITGQLFQDLNSNGQQDAGEFGINRWAVELVDTDSGLVVATTTSGGVDVDGDGAIDPLTEAGRYAFTDLPAGSYETQVTAPAGWSQTSPISDPASRLFSVRGSGTSLTIYELDPADGGELNSFAAPPTVTAGMQGLAVGPDSLFYLDAGNPAVQPVLWELDLDTGAVIDSDSLPVAFPAFAMGVAWLDGEVYIQNQPGEITVFDPTTDTIVRTLSVAGNAAGGLAAAGDLGVLFACNGSSQILTIDPATGAVLNTFTLGVGALSGGLAYCNGGLLASNMNLDAAGTVHRIDPITGMVLGTLYLGNTGSDKLGGLGGDYINPPAPIWHAIRLATGGIVSGVDYAYHTLNAPGDMNGDGDVDADDIDLLFADFGDAGHAGPQSDLDGDGDADSSDMDILIHNLVETTVGVGTEYGDANLDGQVDTTDLTIMGTYFAHSGVGWAGCDFNGSGLVNITDLVILATYFGFSAPPPGGGDTLGGSAPAMLGPAPMEQSPQAQAASNAPTTSESVTQTSTPVTEPLSAFSTSSAGEPLAVTMSEAVTPAAGAAPAGLAGEPDGQLPLRANMNDVPVKPSRRLGRPNQPAPAVMTLATSDAPTTRRRGKAELLQGQVAVGAATVTRLQSRRRSQGDLFEDNFSALDVDPLMTVDV